MQSGAPFGAVEQALSAMRHGRCVVVVRAFTAPDGMNVRCKH